MHYSIGQFAGGSRVALRDTWIVSTGSVKLKNDKEHALNFRERELLGTLAAKYIWWKTPEEAIAMPQRIIAQVMNLGDYADVQALAAQLGDAALRDVLNTAEIGQFNERSWIYWHYRLGLAPAAAIPPLPALRFA